MICALTLCAGCSFEHGMLRSDVVDGGHDAAQVDAAIDAPPVPCEAWPWSPSNVEECAAGTAIVGPLDGGGTYDTTTGVYTPTGMSPMTPPSALIAQQTTGGPMVRVLAVTTLNVPVGATLVVVGDYPLVLLVHGGATVGGAIDVSARSTIPGAGAGSPALCGQSLGGPGGNASDAGEGGSGGGGGGFGHVGGQGGQASNGGSRGGAGTASSDSDLIPLRGGCAGGRGGNAGGGGNGAGMGGAAGGALQLSVRDAIMVDGELRAAGAGGEGGLASEGGGGGGGSGGALLVEAGAIDIRATAKICANGGSGGEGARTGAGASGAPGTCSSLVAAVTVNQLVLGGDGGDGGYRNSNNGGDGAPGGSSDSGGGGGGSTGRIRIIDSSSDGSSTPVIAGTSTISPQPN